MESQHQLAERKLVVLKGERISDSGSNSAKVLFGLSNPIIVGATSLLFGCALL